MVIELCEQLALKLFVVIPGVVCGEDVPLFAFEGGARQHNRWVLAALASARPSLSSSVLQCTQPVQKDTLCAPSWKRIDGNYKTSLSHSTANEH